MNHYFWAQSNKTENQSLMKKFLSALLLIFFVNLSFAQSNLFLKGTVNDNQGEPVPGVLIKINELENGSVTNANGAFEVSGLSAGEYSLKIIYMGYVLKTEQIKLVTSKENLSYSIDDQSIKLGAVTVSARKREEHLQDVPLSISVVNGQLLKQNEIRGLDQLAGYVPGFFVQQQSTQRPYFVIRGMASDNFNPSSQPRVSVYFNNVPISRSSGSSLDLFDMERVEVLKGPAGALFGRGAMNGSVQYISKKAGSELEGKVALGTGSYNQKLAEGVVNVPLSDQLAVRFAGLYEDRDGYVDNSFGGSLNGKNSTAGRLSFRYLPSAKTRFDLVLNYQKNDAPGVAFMSKIYPNTNGETNVFSDLASFEQGDLLGAFKENQSINLDSKHHFSNSLALSSVTSYRKHEASERWDGDGSAAKALDFSEEINSDQFYQEVRLNYGEGEKFQAVAGASFFHEKIDQTYQLNPNEQHFFHLFTPNPETMVMPDGQPIPVPALPAIPQYGQLGGMPLSTDHEETSWSEATNQSVEIFWDGSYQFDSKWSISAGMRMVFDQLKLDNKQEHTAGAPATLGFFSGNYPNLLFNPRAKIDSSANFSGFTGNIGVQYKPSEQINLYAGYSLGRRPNVLQTKADGFYEVLDDEKVHSFDAGLKANFNRNLLFNLAIFYQNYSDFQTNKWDQEQSTLIVIDGGSATSYGLEADMQYALSKNLKLFANYAWLNSSFDDENSDGIEQEYKGNNFRLAPEHSFSLGLHAVVDVSEDVNVFATPSFTWQSKVYFEDANAEEMSQDGYGLFNLKAGVSLSKLNTTISAWGHNLFDKDYLISGGNAGSLFGIPTFVPGSPRMMGVKLSYTF